MRNLFVMVFLLSLLAVLACGDMGGLNSSSTSEPTPVPTLEPKPAETPRETAERFLTLWQEERLEEMYDFLDSSSQAIVDREAFVSRYRDIAEEATITDIDFKISPAATEGDTEVPFTVTIHTSFFGNIIQENSISLLQEIAPITSNALDDGESGDLVPEWRLQWSPSLIFNELADDTLIHLFPLVPRRGSIIDRKGRALALDAKVPVIGIVPDQITDSEKLIADLSAALEIPPEEVRTQVELDVPSYFFIPVQTLPYMTSDQQLQPFYEMAGLGVLVREETRRIYPYGDSLAHVLGYFAEVNAAQLEELEPLGYAPGDRVGFLGLEGTMEEELRGERGGVLATITSEGAISFTIARRDDKPGTDIYLTIDIDLQQEGETALGERVGSLIAMDPRDNSILVMASYPRFDPNDFSTGLSDAQFATLQDNPDQPFLHRPALATYPPGSTFKVVTMAAGLEEGNFSPGSTIHCVPIWTGLGPNNPARNNWQSIDRGFLTPAEGLMASCNPVFYEIALDLDGIDEKILPRFARDFGFGDFTGMKGLNEAAGIVPGPAWKQEVIGEDWFSGDSVNMGIGQGFVLATPLQIVNLYSALAGDAVLRKPILIDKKGSSGGTVVQEFSAEEIAHLPISESTLTAIREGLMLVIQNPGGTSYQVFKGSNLDAAGKSGTAEDLSFGSDHVFFVAYASRSDPSIVAIAALDEGVSGSAEAGPMVRQLLEARIFGLAEAEVPDLVVE